MTVRIDNVVDRGRYGGHMSTEITVRGSFAAFERPERGTVHATIAYDGPAPEPVYGRVARDLEVVKSSIGRLDDKENGAVTWWSADQLRTWSNRPWNKDGSSFARASRERRPRGEVSGLQRAVPLGRRARREHRGIPRCARRVGTDGETSGSAGEDVRARAVLDAVTRAQQYADALGLGQIRPVAIADAGMLGTRPESGPQGALMRAAAVGGAPGSRTRTRAHRGLG